MKKLFSILLCLCMAVALLPMAVLAEVSYVDYDIAEHELAHVQSALDGVAEVTQDGETIVIKLTSDINGRIHFGNGSTSSESLTGTFLLDLNGKTIDGGQKAETICLDNNVTGTLIITGNGTIKTGVNNIIYVWDATVSFALKDGYDYYTLLKDGENFYDEKNTETHSETWRIRGTDIVMNQVRELGENEYIYAYDVQRTPSFPEGIDSEIEARSPGKPLKFGAEFGNSIKYESSEGFWTVTEVGVYGEKDGFTPVPTANLDGIVDSVAYEYELDADGKNNIVIHKLTDENNDLVGYGVLIAVDEENGYALFVGDLWDSSGAGFLLSKEEVTESEVILNAEQMVQTFHSVSFDPVEISFEKRAGYSSIDEVTVTVTNTGNAACGTLNISLSGGENSSFVLSKTTIEDIETGGSDTFTVVPVRGLRAGTYNETIIVSGSKIMPQVAAEINFTVKKKARSGNGMTGPLLTDKKEPAEEDVVADKTENEIILTVDEKEATVFGEVKVNDVAPFIKNDRVMLPARFVSENLGAEVLWNSEEGMVTITKGETVIVLYIDKDIALVNGEEVKLDSAACIENGRTFVPVRFIAESLNEKVEWNGENRTVTITAAK